MEEKVTFSRQMAAQMENYNLSSAAEKYKNHAKSLNAEVLLIQGIILNGFATKRTIAEAEEEQPE